MHLFASFWILYRGFGRLVVAVDTDFHELGVSRFDGDIFERVRDNRQTTVPYEVLVGVLVV